MGDFVLTTLAAAAVTYLLTPLVRKFATAVGASHAARDRDVHVVPTPLLGGFAMYAGLAAALLVASQLPAISSAFGNTNMVKGLLMAGGVLVIMGFVDDRWGMGALSKLAGQVAAGVILVWSGAQVTWLPKPGGGTLSLSPDQTTTVTILLVVVTINAVNFIDGLDGLAAGVVGIGAASFFVYYYTLTQRLHLQDQTMPALSSAVLAGMCLGFLPHNFHPAKIFMGDTGSMLIGLMLAYAPISSLGMLDYTLLTGPAAHRSGAPNRFGEILPLLLPAAIMLVPYADLLLAVVRRTRAGMSPFAPDKKHLHHRLLDNGHSHRNTVLIMYLWSALFAGSVLWLSIVTTPLLVLVAVTVGCVLVLLLVSMPRLRPWAREPEAQPAGAALAAGDPDGPGPARGRRAGGTRRASSRRRAPASATPPSRPSDSTGPGGGEAGGMRFHPPSAEPAPSRDPARADLLGTSQARHATTTWTARAQRSAGHLGVQALGGQGPAVTGTGGAPGAGSPGGPGVGDWPGSGGGAVPGSGLGSPGEPGPGGRLGSAGRRAAGTGPASPAESRPQADRGAPPWQPAAPPPPWPPTLEPPR